MFLSWKHLFIINVRKICHRNELAFSKVDLFHVKENFGKLPGRCKGYVSNSVVDTGEMICLSSIPVLPLKFSQRPNRDKYC